jgi:hypothetical protein
LKRVSAERELAFIGDYARDSATSTLRTSQTWVRQGSARAFCRSTTERRPTSRRVERRSTGSGGGQDEVASRPPVLRYQQTCPARSNCVQEPLPRMGVCRSGPSRACTVEEVKRCTY